MEVADDNLRVESTAIGGALRDLLQQEREAPKVTGPSVVHVALYIDQVWELNEKSESFKAKVSIFCRWVCPAEHAADSLKHGSDLMHVMWKPRWEPMFRVRDSVGSSVSLKMFNAERDQSGEVFINGMYVVTVTVAEAFDLHAFPFDVQDLNIGIRVDNVPEIRPLQMPCVANVDDGEEKLSVGLGLGRLLLERRREVEAGSDGKLYANHAQLLVRRDGLALPDFKLVKHYPALYRMSRNRLHAVLLYGRVANYHLVNSFLLLLFITLAELTTWAVPPSDAGDRLELSFTLLLVAVGFKNLLVNDMPQVSYLTILDHYTLVSISFLLLATLNHALEGKLGVEWARRRADWLAEEAGSGEATPDLVASVLWWIDLGSFAFFVLLWMLMNLIFYIFVRGQLHWNGLLAEPEIPRRLGFTTADEARNDDDDSYDALRARATNYSRRIYSSSRSSTRRRSQSDLLPTLFVKTQRRPDGRPGNNRVPMMHALSRSRQKKAEDAVIPKRPMVTRFSCFLESRSSQPYNRSAVHLTDGSGGESRRPPVVQKKMSGNV